MIARSDETYIMLISQAERDQLTPFEQKNINLWIPENYKNW